MARYPVLNRHIRQLLSQLDYVDVGDVRYYPCSLATNDDNFYDCVYLVEESGYFSRWGVWPEDDKGKRCLPVGNIKSVRKSDVSVPVNIATKIYATAESGMGYRVFTLKFKNNIFQSYQTGLMVDFLLLPKHCRNTDIIDVFANKVLPDHEVMSDANYYWCLYSI